MFQSAQRSAASTDDAAQRLGRLVGALGLVEQLAGESGELPADPIAIAAGYQQAGPIARRRFDALIAETAAFAAAGIEILLRQRQGRGECRVAAARLANEMRTAIAEMIALVGPR